MRKLFILILASVSLLAFSSCNKDPFADNPYYYLVGEYEVMGTETIKVGAETQSRSLDGGLLSISFLSQTEVTITGTIAATGQFMSGKLVLNDYRISDNDNADVIDVKFSPVGLDGGNVLHFDIRYKGHRTLSEGGVPQNVDGTASITATKKK